jgi:hypothetical protein
MAGRMYRTVVVAEGHHEGGRRRAVPHCAFRSDSIYQQQLAGFHHLARNETVSSVQTEIAQVIRRTKNRIQTFAGDLQFDRGHELEGGEFRIIWNETKPQD